LVSRFDESLWLKEDVETPEDAAFAVRALSLPSASSILDVPCGIGRVSLPLARLNYAVTGVDFVKAFVEKAKKNAQLAGLAVEFFRADMRDLPFCAQFDGIFNWLGSFGYFSDEENDRVVAGFARSLRSRGRVLVDQPNRNFLIANFKAEGEIRGIKTRNRWDETTNRLIGIKVVDGIPEESSTTVVRLYTLEEMTDLFARHGLTLISTFGSKGGEDYTPESRRLICVAEKRGSE
jgi:SAM-dependent methyltransferase